MCTLVPTEAVPFGMMARDQLILRYVPLVRHAVGPFANSRPAHLEAEDIYSYGTMGLIDAIDRFDASRGVKFETYAVTRIRGYLLDQLRAFDWLPRSARTNVRLVQHASARVEGQLGRKPDRDELAKETGLPAETCARALANSVMHTVSLEGTFTYDDDSAPASLLDRLEDEDSPNPALNSERAELKSGVATALAALPEREREVVRLRYEREWTNKQIALHMDISESRVSQLHAQALSRLRRALSGMFGDLDHDRLSA